MPDPTFQCSVITPEARVYEGRVQSVVLPAHDGEIGVLLNRAPLLCKLGAGALRIRGEDGVQRWFIDEGFAQVLENQVIVLTQRALRPEEIDRDAAQAQLDAARHMEATDDVAARRKARLETSARAQLRMTEP